MGKQEYIHGFKWGLHGLKEYTRDYGMKSILLEYLDDYMVA